MCDTILSLAATTRGGATLFGKNSDRQRNEAEVVEKLPAREYPSQSEVQCTYIAIPQARKTHAVLLCRPHWGWGAEMGANAFGVAIGNEAVHARWSAPEAPALTGMDLLRLALERAETAGEAVEVITSLLMAFGQGGDGGHIAPSYYNNSFLIADPIEGFVLETVGSDWLVERVASSRAISNCYSIKDAERSSGGLSALLRGSNLPEGYAAALADPDREHIGHAAKRQARAQSILDQSTGTTDVATFMRVLRDHGEDPSWEPVSAEHRAVCMHAQGHDRNGQTAGSLISELSFGGGIHWVTATSAPCLSIYKPVLFNVPLPAHGSVPGDLYNADSLWWRHERFHRAALAAGFRETLDRISLERDALERAMRKRMVAVSLADGETQAEAVAQCWRDALELEQSWYSSLEGDISFDRSAFGLAWNKMNRIAALR